MVQEVTSLEEFNAILKSNKVVIVDFFATWCGPCKQISPKYTQLSDLHTAAKFIKVDVEEAPEIAETMNVASMPTFLIFVDGEKVDMVLGANPAKLEAAVKAVVG
ncbi:Cytoplasmic thioredoxin isoenzyme 2 [Thoreauomyces humboldtii]|nr:Cytoplasmic thioredoxin isoenzyme 2 [Thoreauomyces humboldtii]